MTPDSRWVTVAFTWNGLRALGVDETSLATFPEEFRQGMAARAAVLGLTGANHPDHWVGGSRSPELHAIVILFARDVAERERCRAGTPAISRRVRRDGALESRPRGDAAPSSTRTSISATGTACRRPVVEGTGDEPTPGSGAAAQGRRVLPRLPRRGRILHRRSRNPRSSRRNGSYLAYSACRSTSARSASSCAARQDAGGAGAGGGQAHGPLAQRGALVLAPEQDDPAARRRHAAQQRLRLRTMDPYGYACPLGAHIRRMNPRDTAQNMNAAR